MFKRKRNLPVHKRYCSLCTAVKKSRNPRKADGELVEHVLRHHTTKESHA